ncbi:RNA polymerase sigma factor [Streptomyces rubiginosohelvolus]|uniref:RNA polymerase sigma factor n=1 Tax=Streptomyces rubiginosohelvolus TaxID=67362 RepID=UPI0036CD64F1
MSRVDASPHSTKGFADDQQAAAQRAADAELFEQLKADGFVGARFDMLKDRLWVYGWKVLRAWMRDGTIIERCRERRIHFPAPYTEIEELMRRDEVRQEIAIDCLTTAVPQFLANCLQEWRPSGGRGLNTWFLHIALYHYREAYRRWAGGHRQRMREILGPDMVTVYNMESGKWGFTPVESPENQTVLRETLRIILAEASMEERAVCEAMLQETGATQEEIAQKLQTTRKSVERRLSRVRQRARKLGDAGLIIIPSVSSAVPR